MAGGLAAVPMSVALPPGNRTGRWDVVPSGAYIQPPPPPSYEDPELPPPSTKNPPSLPPSPQVSAAAASESGGKGKGVVELPGLPVNQSTLSRRQRRNQAKREGAAKRARERANPVAGADCYPMPLGPDGSRGGGFVGNEEQRPSKKFKGQGAPSHSVQKGTAWSGNGRGFPPATHDAQAQDGGFPFVLQYMLDQILGNSENNCKQLHGEREAALRRCATAENRLKAAYITADGLSRGLKEGRQKHEAELDQSKKELSSAQAAKDAVVEDLDAVIKALVASKAELMAARAELTKSQTECANQAKASAATGTIMASLREHNSALGTQLGTIAGQLRTGSNDPQEVLAAIASLQSALEAAKLEVKHVEGDRSSIAAQCQEVTNELRKGNERLEHLEREGLEHERIVQQLEGKLHAEDALLEARQPLEQKLEEALAAEKEALAAEKKKSTLGEEALRKLEAIQEVLGVQSGAKLGLQLERDRELAAKENELQELRGKMRGVRGQMKSLIRAQIDLEKRAEANLCLCLERGANTAIMPCGHSMCSVCWESHEERHKPVAGQKEKQSPVTCPICRAEVYLAQPLYNIGLIDDSAILV